MRLSTPISKHLRSVPSWKKAAADRKAGFRMAMRGKAYGYEPTLDAWNWFNVGWDQGFVKGFSK